MSSSHFGSGSLSPPVPRVVPAQLAYLAIYNPSLGPTDETFGDQLVYYYSRVASEARIAARKSARNDSAGGDALRREENEKLRRIGLVQGMIGFARTFADGEAIDAIETEKTRAVVHELESGWWVVASVNLTQLPASTSTTSHSNSVGSRAAKTAKRDETTSKQEIEYSAREVSPPALLRQHLIQAHRVFSLHHGPSLSLLYSRLGREKLSSALERFWTSFVRRWNVLLHGNPAADIFDGLKVACGGELGIGVGEEEWGSGERDVLEDLVGRTEGLVDLVVSRFGDAEVDQEASHTAAYSMPDALPWMGSGNAPVSTDGVVFGGTGSLTRASLRDVSLWMQQVYTYGEHAYGVRDNPLRERRKRRKRDSVSTLRPANRRAGRSGDSEADRTSTSPPRDTSTESPSHVDRKNSVNDDDVITIPPGIPPPIVSAAQKSLESATQKADSRKSSTPTTPGEESGTTLGIPDQYMKYLTFGLSTLAKPSSVKRPAAPSRSSTVSQSHSLKSSSAKGTTTKAAHAGNLTIIDPMPDGETLAAKIARQKWQENQGHFAIGLKGDLDELREREDDQDSDEDSMDESHDSRTVLRTLYVEVNSDLKDGDSEARRPKLDSLRRPSDMILVNDPKVRDRYRLRTVVYVRRPFIYCFLFQNRTASLQYSHFYRELHRVLLPIHKPLLLSTNATDVAARIEASHETSGTIGSTRTPNGTNELPYRGVIPGSCDIYDLLYNPHTLTLHTSIPNIPEPGTSAAEGIVEGHATATSSRQWTRMDALNVHHQILQTYADVRRRPDELERTSMTNRGWWIVWMRVAPPGDNLDSSVSVVDSAVTAVAGHDEGSSLHRPQQEDFPNSSSLSTAAAPQEAWRTAFLVRKAHDSSPVALSYSRAIGREADRESERGDASSMMGGGGNTSRGFFAGFPGLAAFRGADQVDSTSATAESTTSASNLASSAKRMEERSRRGSAASGGLLTGGIGFDARRYVEGLMSLNR